jgi:hypothetical protein
MPSSNPLALSDFEILQWQDAIADATQPTCWHYHLLFLKRAKDLHAEQNDVGEKVFTKLALWTTPRLSDDETQPFSELFLDAIPQEDFVLLRCAPY